MARFGVYPLGDVLMLDCQADILDYLNTRFVVPLLPLRDVPSLLPALHPGFDIEGRQLIMATNLAASVPARALGRKVASLHHEQDAIMRALDMLLVGF